MAHPEIWYHKDERRFNKRLKQLIKRSNNLKPAFHTIGRMFRQSRRTIFQLKSPGGFPDLTPRYKSRKAKEVGFIYPILKRTGRLEKSLTERGHPDNITVIDKKSFALGSRVPYAKYHNSGRPRRKIPLRKFVFWGPEAPRTMRNMTYQTKNFADRALAVIKEFIARDRRDSK